MRRVESQFRSLSDGPETLRFSNDFEFFINAAFKLLHGAGCGHLCGAFKQCLACLQGSMAQRH